MSSTPPEIPRLAALLTVLSERIASMRGAPILLGIVLIFLNLLVQFVPGLGWFADYHILLHIGLIIALIGALLSSAL